uniref:MACRO domain-containing 1 n=1 Tax=Callorhinchus milii TaxID=7868 RepID=V9LCV9_CALMI
MRRGGEATGSVLPSGWREAKKLLKEIDPTERRKYYSTKEFITVDQIQTWKSFAEVEKLKNPESKYKKDDILNGKVSLFQGDITKLEIDAIVNAANSSLLGGGGVDGSIHGAAGGLLRDECSTLGGCNTGDAKISSGYCLPAKYVIHTVGPSVGDTGNLPRDQLLSCYRKSLKTAKDNDLRTIAFPCISTGVYGYPNKPAADVALGAVRQFLEENRNSFDRVIFCVFLEVDSALYKEKMSFYFPHGPGTQSKL